MLRRSLCVCALLCAAVPAAAQESTTVGGYGELHYTNPSGRNTPAVVYQEALEAVATATVRLDGDRIELPNRHTQLDFGGIAVVMGSIESSVCCAPRASVGRLSM